MSGLEGMRLWCCSIILLILMQSAVGQNVMEGVETFTRRTTNVKTTLPSTTTQATTTMATTTKATNTETITTKATYKLTAVATKRGISTSATKSPSHTTSRHNKISVTRRKPFTVVQSSPKKAKKGNGNKGNGSSRSSDKIKNVKPNSKSNNKGNVDKKKDRKDKKQKKKEKRIDKRQKKKQLKKEKKEERILYRKTRNRLKQLRKNARRRIKLGERSYMKNFLRNCSMLFRTIKQEWRERRKNKFTVHPEDEKPANSYEIVQTLNNFGKDIAFSLGRERAQRKRRKESLPISSDDIDMEVSVVSTEQFPGYVFPDPSSNLNVTDSIKLPSDIFTDAGTDNGTIISMVYDAFYEMFSANATYNFANATVNSKILSTSVYPHPTSKLKESVEIVLTHLEKPNSTTPECVFWKVNQSIPDEGYWSAEGCSVFASNATHTICHCNHLTDFAVLFRVSKTKKITQEHKLALTVISLVGCLLSSICLMVTIIVLLVLRKLLRSTRNLLHLNLAVALLVANILFMVADKAIAVRNLCLAVSLGLFYFFLVAFFVMFGEGIYIWIMVAKAFSRNLKKWMYVCIGWGIPLVIVGVSFGILQFNMVASDFCWLSVNSGAIWAFIGPVVSVIMVNLCILVKVLCTAVEHQSDGSGLKVSARLTLVLMPVLGLTWLFGVFAMNEETLVFEYLFTIFNSFQGLFIFICYVLLNGEVKTEYQKLKAKKEYSQSLHVKSSTSTKETRKSRSGIQSEEEIQMVP